MLLRRDALHFEVVLWWLDEVGPHDNLARSHRRSHPPILSRIKPRVVFF